ncbi:cyclic nucleotide-binding domain-containing protein [Jannaschia sp. LMIT008]|uniref:cyclic nucleotide-binding domain-containing protein n=1 Tax=Jannaschia maritima TaxID=3032585 RepID=UPI002811E918|nr:cyclic nucleotide-binding domain-containing protein [Jannaschia sp. LMIT008]
MALLQTVPPWLWIQGALACYLSGFLFRDEVALRSLIVVGSSFYLIYYATVGDTPLWDALLASVAIISVNLAMLLVIGRERSLLGLSPLGREVVAATGLAPGQVRALLRHAMPVTAETDLDLIRAGRMPEAIWLVLSGPVDVRRDGRTMPLRRGNFAGELAYMLDRPATADVVARPGSRAVGWEVGRLRTLLRRRPVLDARLTALMGTDVARKLAAPAAVPGDAR